jgi:hypothetical protein
MRPRFDPLSEASRVPPSAIRSEPHIQRDRASQQYQVGADAASGAAESQCAEAYQGFAFPLASRLRAQPIAIPRVAARDGVRRSKAEATNSCRVRGQPMSSWQAHATDMLRAFLAQASPRRQKGFGARTRHPQRRRPSNSSRRRLSSRRAGRRFGGMGDPRPVRNWTCAVVFARWRLFHGLRARIAR